MSSGVNENENENEKEASDDGVPMLIPNLLKSQSSIDDNIGHEIDVV